MEGHPPVTQRTSNAALARAMKRCAPHSGEVLVFVEQSKQRLGDFEKVFKGRCRHAGEPGVVGAPGPRFGGFKTP